MTAGVGRAAETEPQSAIRDPAYANFEETGNPPLHVTENEGRITRQPCHGSALSASGYSCFTSVAFLSSRNATNRECRR
jgi:hypothetical protein